MPRPRLARPKYELKLRGRVWQVTWTDPERSRTRAVSTGKTDLDEATVWRDQWLAGLAQPQPPQQPRIDAILDGYLAERKPVVASFQTLQFDAKAIKRHVGNLEPHMLARRTYVELRRKEGVSDGTIRREVGTLRAALQWAVREKWIKEAEKPYVESAPKPGPRERWLTRSEVEKLIAACRTPHVKLFVILAYHTAARRNAILDLTWDRVDFEHRRVDYRRPGRNSGNKRRAVVPLNPVALAALQEARKAATGAIRRRKSNEAITQEDVEAEVGRAYVIEYHGRPVSSVRTGFAEACDRAGITECSPHILRHTAATHMVMARVPLGVIARMLGDKEEMVERVYGKWSPDYLREGADALAGDFGPRLVSDALSEK